MTITLITIAILIGLLALYFSETEKPLQEILTNIYTEDMEMSLRTGSIVEYKGVEYKYILIGNNKTWMPKKKK
jgi:uncharacterized protein YpmB